MTDKWTLYHQTGPDGQEWGVRVRPGYIVTGFAREDAEAVVAWQNAAVSRPAGDVVERAKASVENIDHYAYDCDFVEARLVILELIDEVERLRSAYLAYSQRHDSIFQKVIKRNKAQRIRIKELEAELRGIESLHEKLHDYGRERNAYINRLETAFQEVFAKNRYHEFIIDDMYVNEEKLKQSYRDELKAAAEKQAREALEKIRNG